MKKILSFDQLPIAVDQLREKLDSIEALLLKEKECVTQPTEQFLTIQDASELLKLKVPTLYSKISKGELPCMKRSKRVYFSKNDLIEYLKKGRRKTNDEIEEEALNYLNKRGGSNV